MVLISANVMNTAQHTVGLPVGQGRWLAVGVRNCRLQASVEETPAAWPTLFYITSYGILLHPPTIFAVARSSQKRDPSQLNLRGAIRSARFVSRCGVLVYLLLLGFALVKV